MVIATSAQITYQASYSDRKITQLLSTSRGEEPLLSTGERKRLPSYPVCSLWLVPKPSRGLRVNAVGAIYQSPTAYYP